MTGTTTRINLNGTTQVGLDQGQSLNPSISANGRFAVFESYATKNQLVTDFDPVVLPQIYWRDINANKTVAVSHAFDDPDKGGNAASTNASVNSDGTRVVYQSAATDLVDKDAKDAITDIFLYRGASSSTVKITRGADKSSAMPDISDNGKAVVFQSDATNLIPPDVDTAGFTDIFLATLTAEGTVSNTVRVSLPDNLTDAKANQADANSANAVVNGDGSVIAFTSDATNLVKNDTNGKTDAFIRQVGSNRTIRVDVYPDGKEIAGGITTTAAVDANGAPIQDKPIAISADGKVVAFQTDTSLVPQDTNAFIDIYVRDFTKGTTELVSVSDAKLGNIVGDKQSINPSLSADGNLVVFSTLAGNLILGDNNTEYDIYIYNRTAKTTERLSVDTTGIQANNASYRSEVNADGRYTAFDSFASNLVTGDTNNEEDIFLRDQEGTVPNGGDFVNKIFYQQSSFNGTNPQAANVVQFDPNNGQFSNFVENQVTNLPGFKISAVGNFDTDASTEIVIYSPSTGQNFVFNPFDTVQFTAPLRDPNNAAAILNTANILPVAAADLNGDGTSEIIYRKGVLTTGETDTTPNIPDGSNYSYDVITRQFTLINVTTDSAPMAAGNLDADNHVEIVYGNPVSGEFNVYDVVTQQFSELFADPQQTAPGFVATGMLQYTTDIPDLVVFQSQTNAQTVGYSVTRGEFDAAIATTPGWFSLA